MASNLDIKVTDLAYHRNGVCGVGFYVARFSFKDGRKCRQAIATIFDVEDEICTGVVVLDEHGPDIHSTWRGDHFHDALKSFAKSEQGQALAFPSLYPSAAA